ncbi:MAG: Ig-like domain-containing domain [Bergeyella zoohelcum]|nr:Ig-like domain-containing domain [Bergeyella zoohelcum]
MRNYFFIIIFAFLVQSCARVGSPVGGSKDTLAPRFTYANIDTTRVNVSTDFKKLMLYFDEYITLKEVQKNLIISPPIKVRRILPSSLGNKYIQIEWAEPLQENTTYNFNFGNSITDLNEGNVLPYFNFAFSTGDKLDGLYISGEVQNGMERNDPTKLPPDAEKRNFVVGLYKEQDSINYREKPYYITKADPDGYFEMNYLSAGKYRIIAFDDENQNSVFDEGKEKIAFRKEPLELSENISGTKMSLFSSKKALKYKETKEKAGGVMLVFEGNPQRVEVQSLNDKLKEYKVAHRPKSDTAIIWFNAKSQNIGTSQSENLKFSYKADEKTGEASIFYRANDKEEMTISNQKGATIPPHRDFEIISNFELKNLDTQNWKLNIDSLTTQPFTAKISENNPYKILVSSAFEIGKKYSLTIPKESVSSYYKRIDKTYQFNFEIDREENYGSFGLELINAPTQKFWIQFLNDKYEVQWSKYTNEAKNQFTELKPGQYILRILVDNNENGFWDEADFKNQTNAEAVYVFPKIIEIRQLWENKETWDLQSGSTETRGLLEQKNNENEENMG